MKAAASTGAAAAKPSLRRRPVPSGPSAAPGFSKLTAEQHVLSILRGAERRQYAPLDAHLRQYFLKNKEALKAPKMRRDISSRVYHLTTWRGLLDHLVDNTGLKYVSWEDRSAMLKKIDVKEKLEDKSLPLFRSLWLTSCTDDVISIAKGSNFGAPLTIRANAIKITRDNLIRTLKEKYNFQIKPTERSHLGINFVIKPLEPLQSKQEFKDGLFEFQDEASQISALMVEPKPGDSVLDFCAGSGGKTLAFAYKMEGKGALHLHDIPPLLQVARKRLARAGIANAQFHALEEQEAPTRESEELDDGAADTEADEKTPKVPKEAEAVYKQLDLLSGKMNWVLADVPCSGTGVYRRNPDMRWRYSEETMSRLIELQRRVATTAAKFLAPGGHLLYSTCSILKEENDDQVAALRKSEKLELVGEPFRSLPQQGGMDGFYAAILKRT